MTDLAAVMDEPSIVLTGSFNPAIFHPLWFGQHGLLPDDEAKVKVTTKDDDARLAQGLGIVHPRLTQFQLDWVRVQVTQDRFAAIADAGHSLPLRDLVLGTFRLLEHTPVGAMGLNRMMHFPMKDDEEWHLLGDTLAPKDFWREVLDGRPGLRSLTIEGKRHGSEARVMTVKIEPSLRVTNGIFLETNEHFGALPLEQPDPTENLKPGSAVKFMDLLAANWDASQAFVSHLANSLVGKIRSERRV